MNRLQLPPTYKVKDSMQGVLEYVLEASLFIKGLIDNASSVCSPPFQVDLLVAVKEVEAQFAEQPVITPEADDIDSDSDGEEQKMDPQADNIGDVHAAFKEQAIYYAPHDDRLALDDMFNKAKGNGSRSTTINRCINTSYQQLRR